MSANVGSTDAVEADIVWGDRGAAAVPHSDGVRVRSLNADVDVLSLENVVQWEERRLLNVADVQR